MQIAVLTILSKIVNGGCFFITKKVECIYKKYTEAERREKGVTNGRNVV